MEKGPPTTVLDVCKMHEWAEFVHIMACFDFLQDVALVQGYATGGIDDFRITVTACEWFRFNAYRVYF
jgi:hypothetical protein